MAKQIEPVQIWNNGVVTEAVWLSCYGNYDNFESFASFSYNLCADNQGQLGESLATGTVTMGEPEYNNYTTNDYAYNYIATTLGLTIINQ
jgi:hypothetical protein